MANCVVFELRLPQEFASWRDATSAVLSAYSGGITEETDGNPWLLSKYPGYNDRFFSPYPGYKLELATYRAKYDTEYRPPFTRQDAIKPHSMSKYRVINSGTWACNPFSLDASTSFKYLRRLLTMHIDANGPYGSLQPAVSSTTHTPNHIIASQNTCPENITLHDHEAFGHIRAGHRLQWRNMLRELRRGILNISHKDVHLLFLQAMWQAGPKSKSNEWRREAHADGAETVFGTEAIEEINKVLDSIEDNWTWAYACATLVAMAARVLSLTDELQVQDVAIKFLERVRMVAHKWLKEITGATSKTDSDTTGAKPDRGTTASATQALLVAALCCSTFDVDEEHLDRVFHSPGDLSLFVKCRHIVCMNKPPVFDTLPYALRILFRRDELLAIRLLPRLTAKSGIDEGIAAVWHGYIPTGIWTQYGYYNRWYTTQTVGAQNSEVHFNLLGTHGL
jgi:hypothetical protein